MRHLMLLMTILLIALSSACGPRLVKHPDSPMLIEDVSWGKVSVAIYSKERNGMIHYGWVDVPEGWTLHKFDWENYISQKGD